MSAEQNTIRIHVDVTNPGQYFACCGLLELADRLSPGAEGWFDGSEFRIAAAGAPAHFLQTLLRAVVDSPLTPCWPKEATVSPLKLNGAFNLRLDWWLDERSGGSTYKTWAGQQKVVSIAGAMHRAMERAMELGPRLFEFAEVIPDPEAPKKSVAPFYFDARRAAGAQNLDVGFSTDAQGINTLSFPSVEFLCLVGLQRFRPSAEANRTYTYVAWSHPLAPSVAAAVACGAVAMPDVRRFSFRLMFRTKYLKGFLPATPIGEFA